jgi:hypothetical protein
MSAQHHWHDNKEKIVAQSVARSLKRHESKKKQK